MKHSSVISLTLLLLSSGTVASGGMQDAASADRTGTTAPSGVSLARQPANPPDATRKTLPDPAN